MDFKDCYDFANANKTCYLATADGDQPRVRAMGMWYADETGFYFQTSTTKEFTHQLEKNPKTEICFYKHKGMIGTMLRVSGIIEFLNEAEGKGVKAYSADSTTDVGLRVTGLGGIISFLRFPVEA